jgi:hypothetical protein
MSILYYKRTKLAQALADGLLGKALFGDSTNGLFLAAPRRTGKSTFLQNDLRPALEAQGVVVIYVDLWSDTKRDPGSLISEAIGHELTKHLGFLPKLAKSAHLDSIGVAGWLKIDTSKIGQQGGVTLADALKALHGAAKKPIALLIDEAQHALTSADGESAMSALKSARDQMNQPGSTNLMLVMSGSDRDKLLRLVNTNGAPFFGSAISRMPELARDFVEFVADIIEKQRPELNPVDVDVLCEAFQTFGCRPQFFAVALGEALNPMSNSSQRFELDVLAAAKQRQIDDESQMESDYLSLKPLEQAVLWRILELGAKFRPYDADARAFYDEKIKKKVSAQQVQNVLECLRLQNPSLVWKSARGEYALDDAMMHSWYKSRLSQQYWPPGIGKP